MSPVALGDLAIGDFDALAGGLASCPPGGRARFLRTRIRKMFERRGAELVRIIDTASGAAINVLSVWRALRAEDLVGEVKQSDLAVVVEALGFEGAGFPLPLKKGVRILRWPGLDREHVHSALERPAVETMSGYDLLYRMIVRG